MEENIGAVIREFKSLKAKDQGILADILRQVSDVSTYKQLANSSYIDLLSEQANEWLKRALQNGELQQIRAALNITTLKTSQKKSLINSAIVVILVGCGSLFLASRIVCLVGSCVIATEGTNLLSTKGMNINASTAQLAQSAPPYILGLGGILLLAGLLKSESESE